MELNIKGHIVLIDDSDWDTIKDYTWRIVKRPKLYYVEAYHNGKNIYMHRLLMAASDGVEDDHENHNGLDCRRRNLRLITHAGNARNSRRKNKSGFKGVEITNKKFRSRIRIDGKHIHLGTFDSAGEAAIAYQEAYAKQIKKEIL